MSICEMYPHTLDYFILDEKPAEDVIFLICRLQEKGKNVATPPQPKETKKRVYADQVNWY